MSSTKPVRPQSIDIRTTSPTANPVTLSYSFWHRRFDANPNCIGQTLILGGVPFTITGVAAPNFNGPLVPTRMAPTAFPDLNILSPDSAHLNLVGRLSFH